MGLTKEEKPAYTLSSIEKSLIFWGGLTALILMSNNSISSSSNSDGSYKGIYSDDLATDRYMINAAEQDSRAAGF